MKYFTADQHFGDKRLFLFPRYFKDEVEMGKLIIKHWNSIITNDDEVSIRYLDWLYKKHRSNWPPSSQLTDALKRCFYITNQLRDGQ